MEKVDRIKNLQKAILFFSHLLDKYDNPEDIKEELQQEIRICIDKIKRIEANSHKDKRIEITFTERKVKINNLPELNKTYPLILTEVIILYEKIHWLQGFIYLDWIRRKAPLKNPKYTFGINFSESKNEIIKKGLLNIYHIKGENEWSTNIEKAKEKLNCNLFKAKEHYRNAEYNFKQGNINAAINELENSIKLPEYQKVKYIDAYNLLIKCFIEKEFKNIPNELLSKAENFFAWYRQRLSRAISVIERIYIKKGIIIKLEIDDELENLIFEKENADRYYRALKNNMPISKSNEEYIQLSKLIKSVLDLVEIDIKTTDRISYDILETNEFIKLKKHKKFQTIYRVLEPLIIKDNESNKEDIIQIIDLNLLYVISNSMLLENFDTSEEIIECILKDMKKRLKYKI